MSTHTFQMRLGCRYEQPDNTVADLLVQNLEDGEWRVFDLNFRQPGFLIFVYAILNCQHLYLRTNAAERGLLLESAAGTIDVLADDDWNLQRLHVYFEVGLKAGAPLPEDKDYIVERMQHCPVSINLKAVPDGQIRVDFIPASTV